MQSNAMNVLYVVCVSSSVSCVSADVRDASVLQRVRYVLREVPRHRHRVAALHKLVHPLPASDPAVVSGHHCYKSERREGKYTSAL